MWVEGGKGGESWGKEAVLSWVEETRDPVLRVCFPAAEEAPPQAASVPGRWWAHLLRGMSQFPGVVAQGLFCILPVTDSVVFGDWCSAWN